MEQNIQGSRLNIAQPSDKNDQIRNIDAMNEYSDPTQLSVFCSMEELAQHYPGGVVLYFKFCGFVIFTNLLLFGCALISWLPFVIKFHDVPISDSIFVGVYSAGDRTNWRLSSVIAVVLSFLFCPMWYRYAKKYTIAEADFDDSNEDYRPEVQNIPASSRFFRRVVSNICFVLVLAGSLAIAYGFAEAQWMAAHGTNENYILATSFMVSIGISVTNMGMANIARTLTNFEKRSTWTAVRSSNALKLTLLKILNVWMFMVAKYNVQQRRRREDSETEHLCYLDLVGRQYFTLILLDLTLSNVIEVLSPMLYARYLRRFGKTSDFQSRAEFDVSVEYLELVYRQYVVYVAFNSFPLVAGLAVITNMVEFYLDRYRLIHLLKATGTTGMRRMVHVLTFFLGLVATTALLSFPSGSAFTINATQSQSHGFWRNCDVMPST
eukprot:c12500_g3_i1.p1 GENE.c12500_g3_i1~~c12500_g3_i1.p1  ORF type:complete len:461 (+),score=115.18 c12500_g3_i1:77-1384(+)